MALIRVTGSSSMMVNDPEYQNHVVFSELYRYIEFYEGLADAVFLWITQGTRSIVNVDSYVFSSIQGSLTSIRMILKEGRINDAYALLRKYHDSVIINIYSIIYLEDNFTIDNLIVEQIDNWLSGKTQLPEYRIMSQYIRLSSRVSEINDALNADDRYKHVRNRCNDHTHYNFFRTVLMNDNKILLSDRVPVLDGFYVDLRDIFVLHIAYLFCVRENYMMSSDYVDSLNCGREPEPNSQYWVAPFVQEAFDHTVAKHRPDLAATIKKQTSMNLA